MNDAYLRFLKEEIAKQQEVSTGMVLLDAAFKIPLGSSLLIEGSASQGTTAILLQLATQLTSAQRLVVYIDAYNSLNHSRLFGIDSNYFMVLRPWDLTAEELLDILETAANHTNDLVLMIDNAYLFDKVLNSSWTLIDFVKRLRYMHSGITIIATQRTKISSTFWPIVVKLYPEENIYWEDEEGMNQLAGHLVKIVGPHGVSLIYIDHFTGRVCKAFEHVKLSIREGKTKMSTFSLDGVTARGAWNFIHTVNQKIRNELQTN